METNPGPEERDAVSDLLEDSGSCQPTLHPLREQQKLRHVLHWAHRFLSNGSEVHYEYCRADSLILDNENHRETQKNLSSFQYPFGRNCNEASFSEVTKGFEERGGTKKHQVDFKSELNNAGYEISTSTNTTEKTLTSDGPACSSQKASSCKNNELPRSTSDLKLSFKGSETIHLDCETVRDMSECWMKKRQTRADEERKGYMSTVRRMKGESSFRLDIYTKDNPESTLKLKMPTNLTVYEQYQLCVDHLRHLKLRQSYQTDPGYSEQTLSAPGDRQGRPGIYSDANMHKSKKKHSKQAIAKEVTDANFTSKCDTFSAICDKKKDRIVYNGNEGRGKDDHSLKTTVKETHVKTDTESFYLDLDRDKCYESTKRPQDATVTPVGNSAAVTVKPGLLLKSHQRGGKGQKKQRDSRDEGMSRVLLSSLGNGKQLIRSQSGRIKNINRLNTQTHSPDDMIKQDTPAEKHTPQNEDPGLSSVCVNMDDTDYKNTPAGVSSCGHWLSLPDEVWLCILSLLSHSDVCRVAIVCRRLHSLSSDNTLWKTMQIENTTLTDCWLMCLSRRRPHSLCLYSCSGSSVTSCGLEMFLSVCRNFLQELRVTSCTGSGLHGDLMLRLIGQLCDHVSSLDVSWSGTTDTGLKALSDGCARLRLKAVVLNGCHVTDDPLKKLIMRHKESLCRLEIFGCQFITTFCLQTIYEMCPDLQTLNIGQVPKVNEHNLTLMSSLLKNLISLNLTGLQAVTDATIDTLVQSCVGLQSLTLRSCPGITDLTLHSISIHTPLIRSLDVSGCSAVTDSGVQSLALKCRCLQQLDLSSTATGNRGVNLLANYCNQHLHTVKLSFCRVSSESILKLCKHCQRLKLLHLYSCVHLPTETQIREVNASVNVYPLLNVAKTCNKFK